MNNFLIYLSLIFFLFSSCKEEKQQEQNSLLKPSWNMATVCDQTLIEIGAISNKQTITIFLKAFQNQFPQQIYIALDQKEIKNINIDKNIINFSVNKKDLDLSQYLLISFEKASPLKTVNIQTSEILNFLQKPLCSNLHCNDPECKEHHHEEHICDDPECKEHHHEEHICDDPECKEHHHHEEHICDDPKCNHNK